MNSWRIRIGLSGLLFIGLLVPSGASAIQGTWATDSGVGPNALAITIEVECAAANFICDTVDGYTDVQTSSLSGSGILDVDADAGTIQFVTDGLVDLGFGPQQTFHALAGSDLEFGYLPFAGVPEFANLEVFATAGPEILPVGFTALAPGDYPLAATLPYAALVDVVGDLEFNVPDIVVPAQDVALTGILRVLGGHQFRRLYGIRVAGSFCPTRSGPDRSDRGRAGGYHRDLCPHEQSFWRGFLRGARGRARLWRCGASGSGSSDDDVLGPGSSPELI